MTTAKMTPELASTLSLAEQHEWFRRATSRRALLRGGMVGAGALAAGPALLGGTAEAASSTLCAPALASSYEYTSGSAVIPFGRPLAYGAAPTTQMSVTWQVPAAVKNPFLRVGSAPWDLGERIASQITNLPTPRTDVVSIDNVPKSAPATIEQYYVTATVSHLTPGHRYYYAIGHDGFDVNAKNLATTNLVQAQQPAFHLVAGDICYAEAHGSGLITDAFDPRVWDGYLNEISPAAAGVPWEICVGNHEMEPWYSPDGYGGMFARFAFPQQQTAYYSFTYGNVAILSLDGNDLTYEMPANRGYSGGAQTAWLEQQLAAYRADAGIAFIVVVFHYAAFSTSSANGSEGGIREEWVPLFDKYNVDLAINGHNHVYERTDPIRGGAATGAAPIGATVDAETQGTTYIVVGGAGESLHAFSAADSYEGAVDDLTDIAAYINESGGKVNETVSWSRVRYTGYCILRVDSVPAKQGGTSKLIVRGL